MRKMKMSILSGAAMSGPPLTFIKRDRQADRRRVAEHFHISGAARERLSESVHVCPADGTSVLQLTMGCLT